MEYEFYTEQDWKLFRKKLPDWQEAYMGKLLEEYRLILEKDTLPSDRYHELEGRLFKDRRKTGVTATDVKRSNLPHLLLSLLRENAITFSDLDDFSKDLQDYLKKVLSYE